jgi:hypothetical protein
VQEIVFPLPLKFDGNSKIKNEAEVRGVGVWERKEEKGPKLSQGSRSLLPSSSAGTYVREGNGPLASVCSFPTNLR